MPQPYTLPQAVPGDPVSALREIAFLLERRRADTHRVKAYRRAADTIEALDDAERADLATSGRWSSLPGIGPKTATVAAQAAAGDVPDYLAGLRDDRDPLAPGGTSIREQLRGDLHTHTTWSDGGSPLEEMVASAAVMGHDYLAITDHSPRLTVAHGLTAERLRDQLELITALNDHRADIRVLRGIEVDILDDGTLDQDAALLGELDVVVASVHSKLRSDSETMTMRMVGAIANPRTNILGHCTGRLITGERGMRPPSSFDADVIFEACRQFNVAVEINSRPERLDPPEELLALAVEVGCLFSIDTDAHAPGQLDFQWYGAEKAVQAGIPAERIINTWPVEDLLAFCRG